MNAAVCRLTDVVRGQEMWIYLQLTLFVLHWFRFFIFLFDLYTRPPITSLPGDNHMIRLFYIRWLPVKQKEKTSMSNGTQKYFSWSHKWLHWITADDEFLFLGFLWLYSRWQMTSTPTCFTAMIIKGFRKVFRTIHEKTTRKGMCRS